VCMCVYVEVTRVMNYNFLYVSHGVRVRVCSCRQLSLMQTIISISLRVCIGSMPSYARTSGYDVSDLHEVCVHCGVRDDAHAEQGEDVRPIPVLLFVRPWIRL
jgi:hypothetical protein